jgi:hypothetical protein
MSLTLSTAVTQVRNSLNEPTAVFWSDTEIEDWIKEGVKDFSTKTLMVEAEASVSLATGVISYAVATCLEPYTALYNNKGLIKAHPRIIGNEATNTPGPPKYYSLFNRKLWVWPAPTASENATVITLLYAKQTDDIALVTDEYQHIPLYYALAKAKFKDKMFAEGGAYMGLFTNFCSFERQDKHGREQDSLDMFKIKTKGDASGAK